MSTDHEGLLPAVRPAFSSIFLRSRGFSPEVVSGPRAFGPFSLYSGISLSSAFLRMRQYRWFGAVIALVVEVETNVPQQAGLYHRSDREGTTNRRPVGMMEKLPNGWGRVRFCFLDSWSEVSLASVLSAKSTNRTRRYIKVR